MPLVGDFHYNGHRLLTRHEDCARTLDKYRINPGNVGTAEQHDANFRTMIEAAVEHGKVVRIGVNGGSLDQGLLADLIQADLEAGQPRGTRGVFLDAMVESALRSARQAQEYGLPAERIVLSAKVSEVQEVVEVNRALAARSRYALHVGLTEAGMGLKGTVGSALALGILLSEGVGDTIRVSLTPAPGESRWPARSCRDSACAASIRASRLVRAAGGPPAASSRNWPRTFRDTFSSGCRTGRLPAWSGWSP